MARSPPHFVRFCHSAMFRTWMNGLDLMPAPVLTFQPMVISGPSGSGKSSLVKQLLTDFQDCFAFGVSHTTRCPRPGERHGSDYFFVKPEQMLKAIGDKEFFEHSEFSGNLYGVSKRAVESAVKTGKICLLVLNMSGVRNIKSTGLSCKYIFIKPPSFAALKRRLMERGTEDEEQLKRRLELVMQELDYADKPGVYDHVILNDEIGEAYYRLQNVLIKDIEAYRDHAANQ